MKYDLQRIERIDFLSPEERIGPGVFAEAQAMADGDASPKYRRLELVLHPSAWALERRGDHLFGWLKNAGAEFEPARTRFRPYPGAPTFVSLPFHADADADAANLRGGLKALQNYQPLRTARIFGPNLFPMLRGAPTLAAPQPPPRGVRASSVRVAVFDGGFDPAHPLLAGHAAAGAETAATLPPHPDCVAHGTAVAGVILHGPLNPHAARDILPSPPASVIGYRVFPLSDPADIDLYEAIDALERAVPRLAAEGVRLLNVSFGPRGPISDDEISRFTYVLDRLAHEWNVLPIVAVGNDGALSASGRIQAPADSVNSLSVGAYSRYEGERYPVTYSCRGPGREGAKANRTSPPSAAASAPPSTSSRPGPASASSSTAPASPPPSSPAAAPSCWGAAPIFRPSSSAP